MNFRKAKITDVEAIHALITYYAKKGLMLARPRTLLYESLRLILATDAAAFSRARGVLGNKI
jgi:N-acetylglutamate synthase-like GNAT family acetyltransferase